MSFFVARDPITHTITDTDTGETATVDIRPLNAGDQVAIQDTIRVLIGDEAEPEVNIGTMKLLIVERALAGWSLDLALNRNTISALKPEIFEQIYRLANGGEPTASPLAEGAS
jgi:hypothetical protein